MSWSELRELGRTTSAGEWEFPSAVIGDAVGVMADMGLLVDWQELRLYQSDGSFVVPDRSVSEAQAGEEWVAMGIRESITGG